MHNNRTTKPAIIALRNGFVILTGVSLDRFSSTVIMNFNKVDNHSHTPRRRNSQERESFIISKLIHYT